MDLFDLFKIYIFVEEITLIEKIFQQKEKTEKGLPQFLHKKT